MKSLNKKNKVKENKIDFVEMREGYFDSIMALGNFIATLPEEVQIFKVEKSSLVMGSVIDPWYILYYLPKSEL